MKSHHPPIQQKNRQQGGIELLLVLCCLVGVVIFFCFTLGIAGVLHDNPRFNELPDVEELLKQRLKILNEEANRKDSALSLLVSRIKRYEDQIAEISKKLLAEVPDYKKRAMESDHLSMMSRYERLKEQVKVVKEELDKLPTDLLKPDSLERKRRTLEKRTAELQKTEKIIRDAERELIGRKDSQSDTSELTETKERLKRELAELKKKRNELDKKTKQAEVAKIWGGMGRFKSPLFVECTKDGVVFYPANRRVSMDDVGDEGLFENMAKRHDAIVMLVRPDGFDSFNKIYGKAIKAEKKVSYEPIDADTSIGFLEGVAGL